MTNVLIMQARRCGKSDYQRRLETERANDIKRLEACVSYYERRVHHGIGWLVFPFTNTEMLFRAQHYREQLAALKRKPL